MVEWVEYIDHAFAIKIANQLVYGSPIPKAVKIRIEGDFGTIEVTPQSKEKTSGQNDKYWEGAKFIYNDDTLEARTYNTVALIDEDNNTIFDIAISESKTEDEIGHFEVELEVSYDIVCIIPITE